MNNEKWTRKQFTQSGLSSKRNEGKPLEIQAEAVTKVRWMARGKNGGTWKISRRLLMKELSRVARNNSIFGAQKIESTGHPPYSPGSGSNDFFLFPTVKNKLRGFSSREEAVDAFKMRVLEIPQLEQKKCYKNWFQRTQKYINHPDKCFEKQ
ncbi:hypothetical protein EVAR_29777_1 [Eumeta japonica]|uniref:Uncharacterized protein n=1 Tax=Eumeta variegata TaxID=151549 RepID=A0A4C1WY32_EUMVA|nr:hypothetical protein EVAR_29777_1 [Eumeta japonica]